jgi:hypothetical protein
MIFNNDFGQKIIAKEIFNNNLKSIFWLVPSKVQRQDNALIVLTREMIIIQGINAFRRNKRTPHMVILHIFIYIEDVV